MLTEGSPGRAAAADDAGAVAPAIEFAITGSGHLAYAAAPTMVFAATASEPTGLAVDSIALTAQVMIDPARRGYDAATRERLAELFGPPASWAPSTQGLVWARVGAVVPAFVERASFALEVPCTYDLEVAAAKYFYALDEGEVPLTFHFNGTVFYRGPGGRLQVAPIRWSASARHGMPVATWRAMIEEHYPGGGWVRVSDETLAALQARRAAGGLPSFDACLRELVEEATDAR